MAIFHLRMSNISRAEGRSSIRSSAYLAGVRLIDDFGLTLTPIGSAAHNAGVVLQDVRGIAVDYSDKPVEHAEISLGPDMPEWASDRQTLWSSVEAIERRRDAQLAKSVIIALPAELTIEQNVELTRGFVTDHLAPQGVPVDWAVHCVPDCEGRPQPHAHIQFPTRELSADGWQQKLRHLDKKPFLRNTREVWAQHANRALDRAGRDERVSHLSFKAQGIDLEPTIKLGPHASRREAAGLRCERAEINQGIRQRNAERILNDPAIAAKAIRYERKGEPTVADVERFARRHSLDATQFRAVAERVTGYLQRQAERWASAVKRTAEKMMLLGEKPEVTATRMRMHRERQDGTELRTQAAARAAVAEVRERLARQQAESKLEPPAQAVAKIRRDMERLPSVVERVRADLEREKGQAPLTAREVAAIRAEARRQSVPEKAKPSTMDRMKEAVRKVAREMQSRGRGYDRGR